MRDEGSITDLKETDEHPILSPDSSAAVSSSDLENNGYSERVLWRVHTTDTTALHTQLKSTRAAAAGTGTPAALESAARDSHS